MNIRRGLVRAWIVLTTLHLLNRIATSMYLPEPGDWYTFLMNWAVPPVAFAIALALLGWILNGFRTKDDPS